MAALRARFEEARKDGDLPPNSDTQGLARYILVIGWRMAFAAQSGATRSELMLTVSMALKAFPSSAGGVRRRSTPIHGRVYGPSV